MRKLIVMVLFVAASAVHAAELSGIAFVNDDGTLRVRGVTVHLFGIYIPTLDETCHRFIRPVRCGPRAVLALQFKVDGFVYCDVRAKRADGSVDALCRTERDPFDRGDDLSTYMLRYGWALARPGAPFEYHALERIARERHLGIWSTPFIPPP